MKISEEKRTDFGFMYHEDIDLCIQCRDSNNTLDEIINMILLMNYTIEMKIKLNNEDIMIIVNNGEIIYNNHNVP